jgi:hypothetical protein
MQEDGHLVTVLLSFERNAFRAELVSRARVQGRHTLSETKKTLELRAPRVMALTKPGKLLKYAQYSNKVDRVQRSCRPCCRDP